MGRVLTVPLSLTMFWEQACAEEVRSAAVLAARTAARKGASQVKPATDAVEFTTVSVALHALDEQSREPVALLARYCAMLGLTRALQRLSLRLR